MSVRVLIVDDHELLAISLATMLEQEGCDVRCPDALDVDTVLACVRGFEPQVTLLDLHLADGVRSLEMIPVMRDLGTSVVMVTSERDPAVLAACVEAGALGLLHKSASLDELVVAVREAAELRTTLTRAERDELLQLLRQQRAAERERLGPFERLTPREQQVLTALMDGLSADAVAQRDFVSLATVRSQIRAVLSKLGVSSQLAAVALARAAGWDPEQPA